MNNDRFPLLQDLKEFNEGYYRLLKRHPKWVIERFLTQDLEIKRLKEQLARPTKPNPEPPNPKPSNSRQIDLSLYPSEIRPFGFHLCGMPQVSRDYENSKLSLKINEQKLVIETYEKLICDLLERNRKLDDALRTSYEINRKEKAEAEKEINKLKSFEGSLSTVFNHVINKH